jgi:hypothetical protein
LPPPGQPTWSRLLTRCLPRPRQPTRSVHQFIDIVGGARRNRTDDLFNVIEENFESEAKKLRRLTELSPELGAAARDRLAQERDACRGRLEEVFADYRVVEDAYEDASDAEDDALMAICAHRCASMEELATKVRYLAGLDSQLEPDQVKTFFASFLPEGGGNRGVRLTIAPVRG